MEVADVLVIGAGPTGLVDASELARHGAKVRIVDRHTGPSVHSKALAVHARTMEVFEDLGVLHDVMRQGRKLHGTSLYQGRNRLVHVDMDDLDTPYPFILSIPQGVTEAVLLAHLRRQGVEVERGLTLTALDQDDYGVTATLTREDGGGERARTPWVVACDGAHSAARRLLGVPFEGADLDTRLAIADLGLDGPLPTDEVHTFVSGAGFVMLIPLPAQGMWRFIADLPQAGPTPALDVHALASLVETRVDLPLELTEPEWTSVFDVRQRRAARLREGRVFLAGDAAHVHSPTGGQGMNTGIQDAYNLAWKLALVVRGVGHPGILDSYDLERRPIAEALVWATERATRVISLRHPVSREMRDLIARILGSFEPIQQRLARSLGEIGLSYRASPLVSEARTSILQAQWIEDRSQETPTLRDLRDFGAGPRAGERAPDGQLLDGARMTRLHAELVGPHHTVLLFDGQAPTPAGYAAMGDLAHELDERYGALVEVFVVVPGRERPAGVGKRTRVLLDPQGEVHLRYGAGAECIYAVRPDGYIGFRSQPIDRLRLLEWLRLTFL